ncbi:hypothetical protein [Ktedonospora formicarum]|uniref:Uncharacterized protein n=1 Tax=Ktedonospora formicarum TaxID=2778364 RepID=A0A8J3IHT6_9CHLR|nr:hypothetical protein [Ktedonospora formicarum]GHO51414.1 hypothetical protein KSX_95770 [Ktedonospora formicarum]
MLRFFTRFQLWKQRRQARQREKIWQKLLEQTEQALTKELEHGVTEYAYKVALVLLPLFPPGCAAQSQWQQTSEFREKASREEQEFADHFPQVIERLGTKKVQALFQAAFIYALIEEREGGKSCYR